jgi:hypothetical protein
MQVHCERMYSSQGLAIVKTLPIRRFAEVSQSHRSKSELCIVYDPSSGHEKDGQEIVDTVHLGSLHRLVGPTFLDKTLNSFRPIVGP